MIHSIENLIRQGIIHLRPDERFGLVQSDIPEFTQQDNTYKFPKLVVKLEDLWVQNTKENADGLRLKLLEDAQALYILKDGNYYVDGTQPKWEPDFEL